MQKEPRFTMSGGRNDHGLPTYTVNETLEAAKGIGIHITAEGENISDLVPNAKEVAEVWGGKDEDISDLIPKPEDDTVVWGRFNALSPTALAQRGIVKADSKAK